MHTRRILIVDDAPEFAHLVQDALKTMSAPLETTVFLSGEEAWLEALKTRFDLVITDLRLPGISGTELVRRLRSRYPEIKIIAVSGLAEAGLGERTRAAGVDAFYRKPVEIPLLMTKIDNLLFDSKPDEKTENQPIDPVTFKNKKTALLVSPPAIPKKISPDEFTTMNEIGPYLRQFIRESGIEGVALTSENGNILLSMGTAEDFMPDSNLMDALHLLKNSLRKTGHQRAETNSIGLLILPGLQYDLIIASLDKYYFWFQLTAGSHPFACGKIFASWNSSKKHFLNLFNKIEQPSAPRPLPPTQKLELPKLDPVLPAVEKGKLTKVETGELPVKPLPKEDVKAFWDSAEADKKNAGISPDAISFDQASSLGLVPKDKS
jgi:CheY-like chemotaxis protein